MAEVVGLLRGQHGPQVFLHLFRGGIGGKPQPPRDADAVGVGHHGGLAVYVPQHQVGGLAAHPGQLQQVLHVVGDFAAKLLFDHPAGAQNVLGLGPPEPAGVDELPDLLLGALTEGLQGGEAGKQCGGHQVYPGVGALGREPHGDEKLQGVGVVQGADGVGVFMLQGLDRLQGQLFFRHGGRSFPGFRHG